MIHVYYEYDFFAQKPYHNSQMYFLVLKLLVLLKRIWAAK